MGVQVIGFKFFSHFVQVKGLFRILSYPYRKEFMILHLKVICAKAVLFVYSYSYEKRFLILSTHRLARKTYYRS